MPINSNGLKVISYTVFTISFFIVILVIFSLYTYIKTYLIYDRSQFANLDLVIEQARKWNIPFIECSSKWNKNIDFLFKLSLYEYWLQTETECLNLVNLI